MNDDALIVARWCWPGLTWCWDVDSGLVFSSAFVQGWPRCVGEIEDAERLIMERELLAERYGRALAGELGLDCYDDLWEFCAKAATAPLETRVRALASVIRSIKP